MAARLHELPAQEVVALLRSVVIGCVEDEQHRFVGVELLLEDDPAALDGLLTRATAATRVPLLRQREAAGGGPQVEPRVAAEVREVILARDGVQVVAATGNDLPLPHWRRRASSARTLAEEVVERGEARHRVERDARHRDRLRDTRHAIAVRVLEAETQRP